MKKHIVVSLIFCFVLSVVGLGCGTKPAASSKEAITASAAFKTAQEKVNYLIAQAKAFYNAKDFQQAVDLAQYVLRYVDTNSQEAKSLLEKAKAELAAMAQKKVSDFKKNLGVTTK